MILGDLFLQDAGGNGTGSLILMGGMFVVLYFFMIRPQQKKQKELKKFIENIKKGDNVVTIGGLHGVVSSIEGDKVVLDVDRGTKLTFSKSSISNDNSKSETKK